MQAMIDQARPNDTVTIPYGLYKGPIRITKPIQLVANDPVKIINPTEEEATLTIESDNVSVQGIHIVDKRINSDVAALVIRGDQNFLENVIVETKGIGIQLRQADYNTLHNVQVIGKIKGDGSPTTSSGHNHGAQPEVKPKQTEKAKRGNGIDVRESDHNRFIKNQVTNVEDGFYVENSDRNHLEQNLVTNSRYGYHFMGTSDTTVINNIGMENVTGSQLMESRKLTVTGNQFLKQQKNPGSQGILLITVQDTLVANNTIEGNRVGLYLEQSSGITVKNNLLSLNFIGMQFLSSSDNVLTDNQFVSNVIQAQAQDSQNNNLNKNYWDNLQGLDVNGDSRSDLPYEMNPFYLGLTDAVPAYQLFFQAPGFVFLEGLFTSGAGSAIKDASPLMQPSDTVLMESGKTSGWGAGILGLILLIGSSSIIYIGVRKS
ncbi:nitrous oxide reductase family maturation protein NosD [Brevibacillus sp. IT-7CA2]|uniref:right-handed parallel beta-helix repeat-containing protein n=1 Tax=Brevibacillus sp. IT-7CA2 TaxID=3026436 RepID=UPI0039E176F6